MKKPSPKPKAKAQKIKKAPPGQQPQESILDKVAHLDALMKEALDAGDYVRARDLADEQEDLLEKLT
jgi:hypothetical protein